MTTRFESPGRIATFLSGFPFRWAIAGGWAIDLYIDRETREHKDVDVAVLRRDQGAIQRYLSERGWSLEKAEHRTLTPWAPGERLELPIHVIWCRNARHDPDFLEIVLNEATESEFLFRRDPTVTLPLDRAFLTAASGLPILAPEIALLYKAKVPNHEDTGSDFLAALPHLEPASRRWLREAVAKLHPGHAWLEAL